MRGRTFTAGYHGRCAAECETGIRPGDLVAYAEHDRLCHVDCTPAPEPAPRVVCQACWLEQPCGCDAA